MLEATGIINNKVYENKLIDAYTVMEYLGLSFPSLENNRQSEGVVEFQLYGRYIKKDVRNKMERHTKKLRIPTTVTVVSKEGTLTLRYYKNKVMQGDNKYKYFPSRIDVFNGKNLFLTVPQDVEVALMHLLYNKCENSPNYREGMDIVYSLIDREAMSQEDLKRMQEVKKVSDEIIQMSESRLRTKAKGVRIKGQRVDAGDHVPVAQIQSKLMALLFANQSEFIKVWNSEDTTLMAVAQELLDLNILVADTRNNGQERTIHFNKAYSRGKMLISGNINTTPVDLIKEYILNNYQVVMNEIIPIRDRVKLKKAQNRLSKDQLSNLMGERAVESASKEIATGGGEASVLEKLNQEALSLDVIFDLAVKHGVITADIENKEVFFNDGENAISLLKYKNTWESETKAKLKKQKAAVTKIVDKLKTLEGGTT